MEVEEGLKVLFELQLAYMAAAFEAMAGLILEKHKQPDDAALTAAAERFQGNVEDFKDCLAAMQSWKNDPQIPNKFVMAFVRMRGYRAGVEAVRLAEIN
jgi:hypothetical protein